MEGFKGTRGPWVASKTDRSIGPISKHDDQSYGMIFPVAWVEFNGKQEHQEADANLIAAAPDMLEALQDVVAAMRQYEMDVDESAPPKHRAMMEKAEAALSKALGQ
ncbi:hypothetical protein [Pantoea piersonii]|uniref:hypothetical protein n=1 Tax=Pantoea piersonii TaxID=2364647 RepID=UPI0028A1A154|nr:hypothetical protein [Pantoea piersonii]